MDIVSRALAQPRQLRDKAPVFILEGAVSADQLLAARGQARAAAALAAGSAHHQRFAGTVVHQVDGVPRGLVADADRARGGGDRAVLADGGEQRDAVLAAPVLRPGAEPDGSLEFKHG
ncbi:hypothetical protein D3C81_1885750 [compost metagenome]